MRYRLRTLLIVLALGPPVLAGAWLDWQRWQAAHAFNNERPAEHGVAVIWDDASPPANSN